MKRAGTGAACRPTRGRYCDPAGGTQTRRLLVLGKGSPGLARPGRPSSLQRVWHQDLIGVLGGCFRQYEVRGFRSRIRPNLNFKFRYIVRFRIRWICQFFSNMIG